MGGPFDRGSLRTPTLFAEDFDQPHRDDGGEPQVIQPSYSAVELAEASANAWAEGHAAGLIEASKQFEDSLHAATRSTVQQLSALRLELQADTESHATAIARLLLDTMATLFPALCASHSETEMRAVLDAILPSVVHEPSVVLSAHPTYTPLLTQCVREFDSDLFARTRIVGVESMAPGDLRIAWSHGVAARHARLVWNRVAAALAEIGLLCPQPSQELQDAA